MKKKKKKQWRGSVSHAGESVADFAHLGKRNNQNDDAYCSWMTQLLWVYSRIHKTHVRFTHANSDLWPLDSDCTHQTVIITAFDNIAEKYMELHSAWAAGRPSKVKYNHLHCLKVHGEETLTASEWHHYQSVCADTRCTQEVGIKSNNLIITKTAPETRRERGFLLLLIKCI